MHRVAPQRIRRDGNPIHEVCGGLNHVALAGQAVQPKVKRVAKAQASSSQVRRSTGGQNEQRDALRRQRIAERIPRKCNVTQPRDCIRRRQLPHLRRAAG